VTAVRALELSLAANAPRIRRSAWPSDAEFVRSRILEQRNDLVLEHLPLVKAIAARWRVKVPAHLEVSDLVQAGILGLLDAACRYDPATEASFAAYATHRIKGAIVDSLRNQDPAPRELRKRYRELEKVRSELSQTLQRYPTEAEVSDRAGVDVDSLRAMLLDIHHLEQMSGPDRHSAGADLERSEDLQREPESTYEETERAWLVNEVIGRLPESYRAVIILHYTTELSLKEIGGSFGVPERRVSRIHRRALQRINAMFAAMGIRSTSEI
jgi:RNA polymerase sigma factor for flagellar operon FliA